VEKHLESTQKAKLSPGPELDALVAEARGEKYVTKGDGKTYAIPYSTKIEFAWELVEEMEKNDSLGGHFFYGDRNWWSFTVNLEGEHGLKGISMIGQTAPHTICLAYLEVRQDTPHTLRTASKGDKNGDT